MVTGSNAAMNLRYLLFLFSPGKRRFNIKLWKTFTDCFNCLPVAAIVDEKIFCCHGGLSPDLQSMEQIRRIMRPTDVPDTGQYPRQAPYRVPTFPVPISTCVMCLTSVLSITAVLGLWQSSMAANNKAAMLSVIMEQATQIFVYFLCILR